MPRKKKDTNGSATATVEEIPEAPTGDEKEPDPDRIMPRPPGFDLKPEEFFDFWRSIPEGLRRQRIIVYPYRILPVCDVLQPLPFEELEQIRLKKRTKPSTNLGKLVEPLGPDWKQEILNRWGAGNYHFKLNDQHPSVKNTICMTTTNWGDHDWDNYPPVLKIEEVVLSDEPKHVNQPYLRWARLHGIRFPGDPDFYESSEQEENEMANVAAVDKLADTVVQLTRDRTNQNQQPPANQDVSLGIEAGRQAINFITESVKRSRELDNKAQDPQEYHKNIMEAAAKLTPPPQGNDANAVIQIMQAQMAAQRDSFAQMMQMQQNFQNTLIASMEQRIQFAEAVARRANERVAPPITPTQVIPAAPQQNPVGIVDTAVKLIEAVERLRGTVNPADQNGGGFSWGEAIQTGAEVVKTVANSYANAKYNEAVAAKGGQPVPPPTPEQIEAGTGEPQEESESAMLTNYLKQLHQPLVNALKQNVHGSQFAADLQKQYGQQAYTWLQGQGKQGLVTLLSSYTPLWADCVKFPHFEVFLDQFLAFGNQAVKPEIVPPRPGRPIPTGDGKIVHAEHRGPTINAQVEKPEPTPPAA